MAHRWWRDPETRSVGKLGVLTLAYLLVLGAGFLAYYFW